MIESTVESRTKDVAPDGMPVSVFTLKNARGMSISVMDLGATWVSCILPVIKGDGSKEQREVLLGCSTLKDYLCQQSYQGATVGRYANRIAGAKYYHNGTYIELSSNQQGNCLHGGADGFDKRRWLVREQECQFIVLELHSFDGDQGFPGNLDVSVRYELTDNNEVKIEYFASTDKATPINLTNHAYFNLLGAEKGQTCKEHILSINACSYLPTNDCGIPLSGPVPVEKTSFDFRVPKLVTEDWLVDEQQQAANGYDHSFILESSCKQGECAASVTSPDGLVTMKLYTTKPAVQLYTGNWLSGTPNREHGEYQNYAGLALETQFLPDSPNHPEWPQPSCFFEPGQEYAFRTCYQFELAQD
jgi:aldose 1-epimerase